MQPERVRTRRNDRFPEAIQQIDNPVDKRHSSAAVRDSSERGTSSGGSGVQHVKVGAAHSGQRVDNFLMRELKGVPRTHVYRIIRRGDVRINKKRCKPDRKLMLGDEVRVPPYSGANVQEPGELSSTLKARLITSCSWKLRTISS